jgi:phosphoglycolate phosphatase
MKALHAYLQEKKHVIWDWNGTLLSDVNHAVETTNRLLREERLPLITVEHYRKIFRFPVIDYYTDLGLNTSPEGFRDICERFNHHFHAGLDKVALWPGVRETLAHVKTWGKIQSVLSASEQKLLNQQVTLFSLDSHFDHVYGIADKSGGSKVERGHQLMSHVGIAPEHTVMIGDTDHDFEVAEALSIDIVLVEHGHQCPTRLHAVHNKVLRLF